MALIIASLLLFDLYCKLMDTFFINRSVKYSTLTMYHITNIQLLYVYNDYSLNGTTLCSSLSNVAAKYIQ